MINPKQKVFTITTVSGTTVIYHGNASVLGDSWFKVEQNMMTVAMHKTSDIISITIKAVESSD